MSDYGTVKDRVANELKRSDLTSEIASTVLRAIEYYADERFWFNEGSDTAATTSGNQYVSLPSGIRVIDAVYATVGGYQYDLMKREFDELEYWHGASNTSGQPLDYAVRGSQARIYPEPNAVYTLTFTGVYDEDALSDDEDANAWCLGVPQDLIVARTKYLLSRDITLDTDHMQAAVIAERESVRRLRDESHRRIADGKVVAAW